MQDRADLTLVAFWAQRYATTGQNYFTRVISQRIGAVLAYAAWRVRLSANAVTLVGLAFVMAACVCLALAAASGWGWLAAAALLFQIGFGFDCADGQLARATGTAGPFGAWLDVVTDHARHLAIVAALAPHLFGAASPVWLAWLALYLLAAGLTVQLQTIAMVKSGGSAPAQLVGLGRVLRRVLKEITDTPLFMLVLCLIAPWPVALAAYCLGMGILGLVQAYGLAALRIRQ